MPQALATATQVADNDQSTATPADREEIAERLFEAFNLRDVEAALDLVHPEIYFLPISAAVMAEGEPYRGRAGIRRYLADVEAHWIELKLHPVHIRAAGEAVVALGQVSGRGPAGAMAKTATTWVFKFRDDLVVHAQVFSDQRAMLEAFGIDR